MRAASERIQGLVRETPLKPSLALSERLDTIVHLKLETMQDTGAFKVRGATNAILGLPEVSRRVGVVAVSSGNHGRAVAWVARSLDIPAVICLTRLVPEVKVRTIQALGAEVITDLADQADATRVARELARERGLSYIDPFDDRAVIAGQGTVALEILKQRPSVDQLIVPVGGGGLISGIAVAAHALRPDLRIIGVTNDRKPAMWECLQAGRIVAVGEEATLADALPGDIPPDNEYTFELCRQHVETIHLVGETAIARAMAFALRRERIVVEGAGAVGLALLLEPRTDLELGRDIVVVCTGDNVMPDRLIQLAQEHPDV